MTLKRWIDTFTIAKVTLSLSTTVGSELNLPRYYNNNVHHNSTLAEYSHQRTHPGLFFYAQRSLFTERTAPPYPESLGAREQSPDAKPLGFLDSCLLPLRRRAHANN